MLNQHKVRSALGYPKVFIGIPVKPSSHRMMIILFALDNSCLNGTIIHPMLLKCMKYEIQQGEENEWKTAAGVRQTSECIKIEKAMLPSIPISQRFYFLQSWL